MRCRCHRPACNAIGGELGRVELLGAPTNLAFVGPQLDQLVVSNFNRWHLAIGEVGLRGAGLAYPELD